VIPEPNPPQFRGDPVLVQDTSTATTLGYIRTRFTWETDRSSIDVLYYGLTVDNLHDSVMAQNVDSNVGDMIKYLHQAPPTGIAPVNVPSHQPFFLPAARAGGERAVRVHPGVSVQLLVLV